MIARSALPYIPEELTELMKYGISKEEQDEGIEKIAKNMVEENDEQEYDEQMYKEWVKHRKDKEWVKDQLKRELKTIGCENIRHLLNQLYLD